MVLLVSIVYVIGWFLLCVSGMFTIVAMFRGKNTRMEFAIPFLIIVGVPVYFAGDYLRTEADTNNLFFWIPLIIGIVVGFFAGYGIED